MGGTRQRLKQALTQARLMRTRTIQILAMLLVLMMVTTQFAGFLFTVKQHEALISVRNDTRDMRITQQALVDAEDAVASFALAPEGGHLDRYFAARELLEAHRPTIRHLDEVASPEDVSAGRYPADQAVTRLERLWERAIGFVKINRREEAARLLQQGVNGNLINVRGDITRYLAIRNAEGAQYEERRELGNKVVTGLQLLGGALILGVLALSFRLSAAEGRRRRAATLDAVAAREQIEKLFRMTDMLQSAAGYDDANAVLHATVQGLMPDLAGALFIFNNSRDRLDLATSWNLPETHLPPDHIAPSACWALKRGKAHVNGGGQSALRCEHQQFDGVVLEIPMSARGEFYGLLCFAATGAGAEDRIAEVHGMATALADSMSLALSSIALREKLRNQALRDPLTGLYNRRYMEDMLQRFGHLSERNARPFSVIMIDLDHFKRLNDDHGHAVGDAVLRDASQAILGNLRQSDVACRYGGEEIIVLLPDIGLVDAAAKAETLRARIESISDRHGTHVTASLGVASVPDNAVNAAGLVGLADEALYKAKKAGRNQVVTAAARPDATQPRTPIARIA
jgi:diguanylate cyclase (GGDEF)-like protein